MVDFMIQVATIILSVVLMLGPIVVVHEFGHYLAGRAFGAAAESFSIGFGKPIFERKDKRNTRWRINWILFGGYVAFVGEGQPTDGQVESDPSTAPVGKMYKALSPLQRSVVSLAGPFANFITAILIFALVAFSFGKPVQKVIVAGFIEGPAQAAGFQVGDKFLSVNNKLIQRPGDILIAVSLSAGDTVDFKIERDGSPVDIAIVPERQTSENEFGHKETTGRIGLQLARESVEHINYSLLGAIGEGVQQTGEIISLTGKMLARIVTGRESITQLNGPIGIGDVTGKVITKTLETETVPLLARFKTLGWTLLQYAALFSVGVGIVNLLPLPVLDGGHLIMNAYEAIVGRPLPEKIQEITLQFSMMFLLGVAAIVTLGDIVKTGILQGFAG